MFAVLNAPLIMLITEDGKYLEYMHSIGFEGDAPEEVKKYRVPMTRVSNIVARVANTGKSEYIPQVKDSKLSQENIILNLGETHFGLCGSPDHPLQSYRGNCDRCRRRKRGSRKKYGKPLKYFPPRSPLPWRMPGSTVN